MAVLPKGLKIPASNDDRTNSPTILHSTLTELTPLLDMKAVAVAPSIPAPILSTPAAAAAAATAGPFDGIHVESEYIRPNGLRYVPRKLSVDGKTVHDVSLLRSAAAARMPVLLYGPPGTGKTALVEAAFPNALTIQGTIETETADFVGSWVQDSLGSYVWVDGPFLVAADEGRPLLIDEIALIDPRSLAIVYGAMDGRDEIVVTQNPARGKVKVQPGFLVLGAFNPNVPGAITSDALMSRFPVQIEVNTDWSLATKLGVNSKMIQVVRNLNHKVESGEMTAAPQLRELLAYRDLSARFGEAFALQNFIGQIRPENRAVAITAIKAVLGDSVNLTALTL
jgi:nitric oxide reductase NorQ protein